MNPTEENPVEKFGTAAITQHLIDTQHHFADIANRQKIRDWHMQTAQTITDNEWWSKVNPHRKPKPIPEPPYLTVIDDQILAQSEQDNIYRQFWHTEQYVPPFVVPPPPPPPTTIDVARGELEGLPPGYFAALHDGPFNPPGMQLTQDGVKYTKHLFGFMGASAWKKELAGGVSVG